MQMMVAKLSQLCLWRTQLNVFTKFHGNLILQLLRHFTHNHKCHQLMVLKEILRSHQSHYNSLSVPKSIAIYPILVKTFLTGPKSPNFHEFQPHHYCGKKKKNISKIQKCWQNNQSVSCGSVAQTAAHLFHLHMTVLQQQQKGHLCLFYSCCTACRSTSKTLLLAEDSLC